MKLISNLLRKTLLYIKNHKALKNIIYDVINVDEFTDFYSHERMLADSRRVNSYKIAIDKYIKEGDTVIDLGTGTGILSFLAAKQKPKKIYAIDQSKFIEVAERIAKHNKIENIEFVYKNSRQFNLAEKADVIVQEQMGLILFEENMLTNILDLKKRVLKKNGLILPGKFSFFVEPAFISGINTPPFIYEQKIHGIDFSFLKQEYASSIFKKQKNDLNYQTTTAFKYFLCNPEPIITFDLNTINTEKEIKTSYNITKEVTKEGFSNGFIIYFNAIFDAENILSTAPDLNETSWERMFFRTEKRHYNIGDKINFSLTMENLVDRSTWSLMVKN
ncbi:50S ribosomal protein L11 methyltransferase [Algibacter pectinivorans]|uniref:Protein arginine N-methyltransferase 1 n=1 Tax=Algibacter pectinivorans TaxID=870482 RepID=A0A1I1QUQ6_9FLAO|nr:50S ribosomal protein L11 methyltransferase [Algibacter pectinivorans]SFD25826.1 protein arginine N-methyltransferase 1 [Algibacter pectinivorans]